MVKIDKSTNIADRMAVPALPLHNSLWGLIFLWLVPNKLPELPFYGTGLPNVFFDLFNVGLTCPSFYLVVQHRAYYRYFQIGYSYLLNNQKAYGTLIKIKNNIFTLYVCEEIRPFVFVTHLRKLTLWQLSLQKMRASGDCVHP